MATSGRGSGMVGYNVQAAVDTTNHLIVAHEVTNISTDKSQLANMANQAKAALGAESLEAFADRGYFKGEEKKVGTGEAVTMIFGGFVAQPGVPGPYSVYGPAKVTVDRRSHTGLDGKSMINETW
jgi:hypothetical protein